MTQLITTTKGQLEEARSLLQDAELLNTQIGGMENTLKDLIRKGNEAMNLARSCETQANKLNAQKEELITQYKNLNSQAFLCLNSTEQDKEKENDAKI